MIIEIVVVGVELLLFEHKYSMDVHAIGRVFPTSRDRRALDSSQRRCFS
jgi:hypothetical protein